MPTRESIVRVEVIDVDDLPPQLAFQRRSPGPRITDRPSRLRQRVDALLVEVADVERVRVVPIGDANVHASAEPENPMDLPPGRGEVDDMLEHVGREDVGRTSVLERELLKTCDEDARG